MKFFEPSGEKKVIYIYIYGFYCFFLLNMSMDSMAIALKKGNPSPAFLRSCYEGLRASRVTSVASFQIEEISKLR